MFLKLPGKPPNSLWIQEEGNVETEEWKKDN
jgi:hypothetical protein